MDALINRIDNIGVAVGNFRTSLEFYAETLGLRVEERDDSGETASLQTGGDTLLYLFATTGPSGPARAADYTGNPTGVDHISFSVDDVDAVHASLQERGVRFFLEPTDADWGARVCGCHDPDGTPVYFLRWR